MKNKIYNYHIIIKETYLDLYGHVNNATYLTLFEEARWDFINRNGYGFNEIKKTGLGPVILEISIRYLKELRLREEIIIQTTTLSYDKKIGKLEQKMIRGKEECCVASFTFGLFNLKDRKLVLPTKEWLNAIGLDS